MRDYNIANLKSFAKLKEIVDTNHLLNKLYGTKIVITGITGQIGSHLAKVLIELSTCNHFSLNIVGLGRNKEKFQNIFHDYLNLDIITFYEVDFLNQHSFPKSSIEDADFIIHCASPANPLDYDRYPVETMLTNFNGFYNLVSPFMRKTNKPEFLFISTGEIYGDITNSSEIDENNYGYINYLDSRSCYPVSKIATETFCASLHKEYGVICKVARLSHVYGPVENENRVVDYMLSCGALKKGISLNTDGQQIRTYTYLMDVIAGLLFIMVNGRPGEAYNVSSNDNISLINFAKLISDISNVSVRTSKKSSEDVRKSIILSNRKLKGIGWQPMTTVFEGIQETLNIIQ